MPEVLEAIEKIPDDVQSVADGVQTEFADLDFCSLAKMSKSVVECVNSIKKTWNFLQGHLK